MTKNDKVTYSDEEFEEQIGDCKRYGWPQPAAMLQQLMEQRDAAVKRCDAFGEWLVAHDAKAERNHEELMGDLRKVELNIPKLEQLISQRDEILKDLKALEAEVSYVFAHKSSMDGSVEYIDLKRSEKYDTEKPD